jgi:hypothetical protein
MGLKPEWMTALETILKNENMEVESLNHEYFHLLFIPDGRLVINLIPIIQQYEPQELVQFQELYQHQNIQLIHLWEDVFLTKKVQVISRIKSILGQNQRIHGRKTKIVKISQPEAELFLNKYHIQGNVGSRHRYGLSFQNEIVAVATFSNKRRMTRKSTDHTSAELIRFATKDGYTVIGGLSKLVKHFVKTVAPNDVMSYADRDWSLGKGYLSSGFKLYAETPPATLLLNVNTLERYFSHRVPLKENEINNNSFVKIFNTGNLKYVLDF